VNKLEEGKIQNNPERLNLKMLISEIVEEMQLLAKDGQAIQLVFEGNEEASLDKKIITHILFNLLSNALKFSPENKPVELTVSHQKLQVQICVRDYGIGIPEADQQHLFERFFRAQNATHVQGTGLGLSIVARYIELINGHISVESKVNEGTLFTMLIPQ
jgi:signal transduction histidine kinase